MSAIKRSDGLIKHFTNSGIDAQFSFYYLDDGTPASTNSFSDEEDVRTSAWYPFLKEGEVVFDIGAGYLSYTMPALAAGCIVYAFSPEHEFSHIQKNLEANKEQGFVKRCHLYNFGLHSEEGYFKTDTMWFKAFGKLPEEELDHSRRVGPAGWWIPVTTLDAFVSKHRNQIKKIDKIKIDVEGAEYDVIKGGLETLKKFKPSSILIEYHLFKDVGLKDKTHPILEKLGYEGKIIRDLEWQPLTHVLYTLASAANP